jgi:hypothetical protein
MHIIAFLTLFFKYFEEEGKERDYCGELKEK